MEAEETDEKTDERLEDANASGSLEEEAEEIHEKTDEVETASPWQKAERTLAATLATRMGLAQRNDAGNDECQLAWVCSLA